MTGRSLPAAQLVDVLRAARLLVGEVPALPEAITGIVDDSRAITAGAAFVAVRGHDADGHAYAPAAVERGAALVIAEQSLDLRVPVVRVSNARLAAALSAAAFYDRPADSLRLVGVTGTNGKTTTVHLVRALLCATGLPTASIGTLGVLTGVTGEPRPGGQGLTTPGPVEMQRVLRELVDAGIRAVALEVSSHALDQGRVDGLAFDAAVFTSFSRDHLDYHGTMAAYFAAKARLVHYLKPDGVAVVNAAEPAWGALPPAPRLLPFAAIAGESAVGAASEPSAAGPVGATVRAEHVRFDATGSRFDVCVQDASHGGTRLSARLPLLGDFNVVNAIGAVAAAWALGRPIEALAAALATMPQVPGRLERLCSHPTVLRDYAHTPDALERALQAVRPFARTGQGAPTRVHVLFGCGGDRDRGKRPEMGAIAERLADAVILTSDNPRTEDPEAILDEIEAGMQPAGEAPARVRLEDRRAAIAYALRTAAPDDVVLLAGKGHETYQIRGTEKRSFDEAAIVAELMAELMAELTAAHQADAAADASPTTGSNA